MARKDLEHHQTIFDSDASRNLVAQNHFLTVVMHACVEEERSCITTTSFSHHRVHGCAATTWLKDGPTSKTTGDFLHVFLCVAAIDAQRVKFHQLACIVFVDPASSLLLWHAESLHGVRTHALEVVEIKEHRRALRRGL